MIRAVEIKMDTGIIDYNTFGYFEVHSDSDHDAKDKATRIWIETICRGKQPEFNIMARIVPLRKRGL